MSEQDLAKLAEECQTFINQRQSLMLGSLVAGSLNGATAADAWPDVSYAPFIWREGVFYVFISELAAHTRNLMASENTSVMFIEDEAGNRNPFARRRASFVCRALEVPRDALAFEPVLADLEDVFGATVGVLKGLSDFRLFALQPVSGRYVVGFGKAYDIDTTDFSLRHVGPDDLKK